MNKNILLLTSKMLKLASDEFSNHGCNDLEKKVYKLITDDILQDLKDDEGYPKKSSQVEDWVLMEYLSDKLKKVANEN